MLPLPLYTSEASPSEILLASEPSDFACLSLAANAATAARRGGRGRWGSSPAGMSPQTPCTPDTPQLLTPHSPQTPITPNSPCTPRDDKPPSYEALYFKKRLHSPMVASPIYSKVNEDAVEILADYPSEKKGRECATCQAGVCCPVHDFNNSSYDRRAYRKA